MKTVAGYLVTTQANSVRPPSRAGVGSPLRQVQITSAGRSLTNFNDSVVGYAVLILLLVAVVLVALIRYHAVLEILKQRDTCGEHTKAEDEERQRDPEV
jgi:large-conductance mechanosensitive channel